MVDEGAPAFGNVRAKKRYSTPMVQGTLFPRTPPTTSPRKSPRTGVRTCVQFETGYILVKSNGEQPEAQQWSAGIPAPTILLCCPSPQMAPSDTRRPQRTHPVVDAAIHRRHFQRRFFVSPAPKRAKKLLGTAGGCTLLQ